jgi:hypothetical protein
MLRAPKIGVGGYLPGAAHKPLPAEHGCRWAAATVNVIYITLSALNLTYRRSIKAPGEPIRLAHT